MQVCDENKLFVASLAIALGFPIQDLVRPSFGEIKNRYKMTNERKNAPPPAYSLIESLANEVGYLGGYLT